MPGRAAPVVVDAYRGAAWDEWFCQAGRALAFPEQPQGEHEADARGNPEGTLFRQAESDPLRTGFDAADDFLDQAGTAVFAECLREYHGGRIHQSAR